MVFLLFLSFTIHIYELNSEHKIYQEYKMLSKKTAS